jgi:hypothetical protein
MSDQEQTAQPANSEPSQQAGNPQPGSPQASSPQASSPQPGSRAHQTTRRSFIAGASAAALGAAVSQTMTGR